MMIPRSFVAQPPLSQKQYTKYEEKDKYTTRTSQNDRQRRKQTSHLSSSLHSSSLPRSISDPVLENRSRPVQIPSRSSKSSIKPSTPLKPSPNLVQSDSKRTPSPPQELKLRPGTPREILSATAIPIRKKSRQKSIQKLPNGNHVADFSKLLLEDVKPANEGILSASLNDPQYEGLFGSINELVEGQMIIGSEGTDRGILSARSLSSESLPSILSHDEFSSSPSIGPSYHDRRHRRLASSEDCASEHPLISNFDEDDEDTGSPLPKLSHSPSPRRAPRPAAQEARSSSFKSSLTASLKAIKLAAQSMSSLAISPLPTQPDDYLARSIFDIQPALTDDRRPPPSDELPSPALRRYLNPHPSASPPDSPAQLHFWLDDRRHPSSTSPSSINDDSTSPVTSKKKSRKKENQTSNRTSSKNLPPVVPLMTCIPSSIRTANASSPPIWLGPDGLPNNKNTSFPMHELQPSPNGHNQIQQQLRQREPRENRDFLRVFVCEMNMRRNGKLSEEAQGKAVLWLPPVKDGSDDHHLVAGTGNAVIDGGGGRNIEKQKKLSQERWKAWRIDEF